MCNNLGIYHSLGIIWNLDHGPILQNRV